MKAIPYALFLLFLCGCAGRFATEDVPARPPPEISSQHRQNVCLGTPDVPTELQGRFEDVDNAELLDSALGDPGKGLLCQGRVYRLKNDADVTVYRAWNSTNPSSRFGKWWAFYRPQGRVALYRHEYEICYQWSPLDKLTDCKLKPGSTVVIGTGQSADCSEYLSYPASAAKQIYIDAAASSLSNCSDYDALFTWQPVRSEQ